MTTETPPKSDIAAFYQAKPVTLTLFCGKVAKAQIAYELGISPKTLRKYLAPILDSSDTLKQRYRDWVKKKLIPPELAEDIVRELLDNNLVRFEYNVATKT